MNVQNLAIVVDLLIGVFVIFALALTAFGFLAYSRTKIKKLLFISMGFGMFLIKGIILSIAFFTPIPFLGGFEIPPDFMLAFAIMLVLDVMILVILYFATFKK